MGRGRIGDQPKLVPRRKMASAGSKSIPVDFRHSSFQSNVGFPTWEAINSVDLTLFLLSLSYIWVWEREVRLVSVEL